MNMHNTVTNPNDAIREAILLYPYNRRDYGDLGHYAIIVVTGARSFQRELDLSNVKLVCGADSWYARTMAC